MEGVRFVGSLIRSAKETGQGTDKADALQSDQSR